ncbi:extensin-like domain-containing protein [Larsenimonas rhizosphaerae]|uniref:Extensin family protein n=1 Tax=Larsenimonas rhizosphaerae TaxID=2944682 RepID=A0AA41ZMJ3_9GAMM|nr:extensin family protein [Larsenimonas rhizosphaerae]MCX2524966.1 extensin family protein [Larsenimonas rhizosphaerae]
MRWFVIGSALLVLVSWYGLGQPTLRSLVPDAYNPLVPLNINDEVTPLTRWKLERLKRDDGACQAVLAQAVKTSDIDVRPVGSFEVQGCPLKNVSRVYRTSVAFNASFLASCPLVVSWLVFERQRLQPITRDMLGTSVARVRHYGSFACRNIYHRANAPRSEHASASAFDLAALELADGRRLDLLTEWPRGDARSEYWHTLFKGACDIFGTSLGPDYNQAHANHFHLGTRRFGLCR